MCSSVLGTHNGLGHRQFNHLSALEFVLKAEVGELLDSGICRSGTMV
jgi:hypothetical protein